MDVDVFRLIRTAPAIGRVFTEEEGEPGNARDSLYRELGCDAKLVTMKLEDAGARPLIHTLRGVGYVLREPE